MFFAKIWLVKIFSFFPDPLFLAHVIHGKLYQNVTVIIYQSNKLFLRSAQGGRSYRSSKSSIEREQEASTDATDAKSTSDPKGTSQVDPQKKKAKYRQFRCKTWKLEPGIRLLGLLGTRVDPVSIDWVLEKLGFTHASLTIPKWIQRGAMDPMDIALSLLLRRLLAEMQVTDEGDKE